MYVGTVKVIRKLLIKIKITYIYSKLPAVQKTSYWIQFLNSINSVMLTKTQPVNWHWFNRDVLLVDNFFVILIVHISLKAVDQK